MERHVKERLVGAALLMAATIILVPEMLSGPPPKHASPAGIADDTPVKTYTVDFSQAHVTQMPDEMPDTRVPPGESPPVPAASEDTGGGSQVHSESKGGNIPAQADSKEAGGEVAVSASNRPQPVNRTVPQPHKAPVATSETGSRPLASSGSAKKDWAVQLGSFGQRSTAERWAAELRSDGHDAFVMPVKSGGTTLYRVRIGPVPSRVSADATLSRIKSKVPGAAVVTHP